MQAAPLVSIIMPSYNSGLFIAESIRSVQAQTLVEWELIVSDDMSSDDTIAIVRDAASRDDRIVLLEAGTNGGPAAARNAAIAAARGRYIAFLDSDDIWKPEKLEKQLAFMRERGIAFSFSSYDRVQEDGSFVDVHRVARPVAYSDLAKHCSIGCLTAVYDTAQLSKVYMPEIRKRQDFALWLKLLKQVELAYPLPESLAVYRIRKSSVSSNKRVAARYTWSVYRDVEGLGLLTASYYFLHYAFHGVWNRRKAFAKRFLPAVLRTSRAASTQPPSG